MKPNLLETFERIVDEGWRGVFSQQQIAQTRALSDHRPAGQRAHASAVERDLRHRPASFRTGPRTTGSGRKVPGKGESYSIRFWTPCPHCSVPAEQPVLAALDDTMAKKTGRRKFQELMAIGRDPDVAAVLRQSLLRAAFCAGLGFSNSPCGWGSCAPCRCVSSSCRQRVKPKSRKRAQAAAPERASLEKSGSTAPA